jgi:biopolymer transport protein ExbD
MAAIETSVKQNRKAGIRLRKKSTRVDLTPMVDLGFLLITFFVFTTTMAKPRVMGLVSPKDADIENPVCESCALTVIPAGENKIYYYEGKLQANTILKSTSYTAEGLRPLLLNKMKAVKKARGNADELSLIIRPSDRSSFKNLIDILDEVYITGVKRYYIDDITPDEKLLLGQKQ